MRSKQTPSPASPDSRRSLDGLPQTNAGGNQNPQQPIDKEALRRRAAAYVRMSTEHQQYSTCNQLEVIREYARRRGLEIVKVYSDDGKSGLSIQGRDSLAQMIRDVQIGNAGFSCVLVYDVSRWGRFQDVDESAYYEYLCRLAGAHVHSPPPYVSPGLFSRTGTRSPSPHLQVFQALTGSSDSPAERSERSSEDSEGSSNS
jgi:hypothetical protein